MGTSGAFGTFSWPPSPTSLVEVDLRRVVKEKLSPTIKETQKMLAEPWRSQYALRFLIRFIAVELYLLIKSPGKGAEKQKKVSAAEIATALRSHQQLLKMVAATWMSPDNKPSIEAQTKALTDAAALLDGVADTLPAVVTDAQRSHGQAFSEEVLRGLLAHRTDIQDATLNAAIVAAVAAGVPEIKMGRKRLSYLPVVEAIAVSDKTMSPYQWATNDLAWVVEVFCMDKNKVQAPDHAKRVRKVKVTSLAEKEKNALLIDDFLGMNFDDFLASDGETDEKSTPAPHQEPELGASPIPSEKDDEAEVDFVDNSDEDNADEFLNGFLYRNCKSALGRGASMAMNDVMSGKLLIATKKIFHGSKTQLTSGWVKAYCAVKRDFRGHRTFYWYDQMGDTVCKGSLPLRSIESLSVQDCEYCGKLTCSLKIQCANSIGRSSSLEFRSQWLSEVKRWSEALQKLKDREASEMMMSNSEPAATLLVLKPTLHFVDPKRLGEGGTDQLPETNAGAGKESEPNSTD